MKVEAETDSNSYMSVKVFGGGGDSMLGEKDREKYKNRIKELEEENKILREKNISEKRLKHALQKQFQALDRHIQDNIIRGGHPDFNATLLNNAITKYNQLIDSYCEIDARQKPVLQNLKVSNNMLNDIEIANDINGASSLRHMVLEMWNKLEGEEDILTDYEYRNKMDGLIKSIENMDARFKEIEGLPRIRQDLMSYQKLIKEGGKQPHSYGKYHDDDEMG